MTHPYIFMHIPKNGGTTFHSILNRIYRHENIFTISSINNKQTNEALLKAMPEQERHAYKIIKGHAVFGLHQYTAPNAKYLTYLRKPEDRIASFYYYVLRKPGNKLYGTIKDNNLSLYDFVTQVDSMDLNNCQIRWISGIDDKEELMLEKALENIDNYFDFVGITEKYNECLILLQHLFNWSSPYYLMQNKTKNRPKKDQIDAKTLEAINAYNHGDNQLYTIISERISTKIKNEPNLKRDLRKLQFYNRLYSNDITRKIGAKLKNI